MSVCCCVSAPGSDYSADACVSSGEGSLRRRSQRHSTTLTSRFFDVWDSLVSGKLFKSSRVKYLRTLNQRDGGNVCFPLSERSGRLLRNCKRQEPPGGRRFDLQWGRGRGFSFKSSITVEEGCCPPIRGQRGVTSHWSLLRQTWAHFKSTFTSASGSVRYVHEMWAGLDTGPESEPTYWQRTRSKWAAQEKQPLS